MSVSDHKKTAISNQPAADSFYYFLLSRLPSFIIGITFLLILIVLPLYAYKVNLKQDYTDFEVYYRSAWRANHHQWSEVYTLKDGASPFRYIPFLIPLFQPFAHLSLSDAQLVWYFLQYFWFGLGFYWIYRSLKCCLRRTSPSRHRSLALAPVPLTLAPLAVTCLGILYILRFCLDTFTIGQVSSLMFCGFCLGLYGWIIRSPKWSVVGILIPTIFKIGPGFLYGIFCSARSREKKSAFRTFCISLISLGIGSLLWTHSWLLTQELWRGWVKIVANDSVYYDASHYGSQSLKSVLLRWVHLGWMNSSVVHPIYWILCGTTACAILLFWIFRSPRNLIGRGLFYSLGLFAYMWLMPETFKYSLTPLAIPVVFLFAHPQKGAFSWISLTFGALTLSLAGKDIIGDPLFFGSQIYSLPFLATLFIAIAVLRLAWRESVPSTLGQSLTRILRSGKEKLGPWESLPEFHRSLEVSLLIPIPFLRSSALDPIFVRKFISECHTLLRSKLGPRFEILLIPYGDRWSALHSISLEIEKLAASPQLNALKILPPVFTSGRGSALRMGFLKSQGKKILFSQIEQPCDPVFFQKALEFLDSGYDLVRANRRLAQSSFTIPVRFLSLVYSRHRLGLWFNKVVRLFLPIQTTDTHSGTLGLSWRLAHDTFAVQTFSDFLFDLEIALTSTAHNYREKDLPVSLSLGYEKDIQRMLQETWMILQGLPILAWRYRRKCYHAVPNLFGITADDWGLSPGVNQGILKLARLGVVKRVSLMANGSHLEKGLEELFSLEGVELGLHFNLTYGRPSQADPDPGCTLLQKKEPQKDCLIPFRFIPFRFIPSPGKFLFHWLNPFENHRIHREFVRKELSAQLEKLKGLGVKIQYLDGHHHIHMVPGLLDTLFDLVQKEGIKRVRLPYDPKLWKSSKFFLLILALLARPRFKKHGFEFFPFIYPQEESIRDQGLLRATLAKKPEAEIIFHPAEMDDIGNLEFPDPYREGRVTEFLALQMLGHRS